MFNFKTVIASRASDIYKWSNHVAVQIITNKRVSTVFYSLINYTMTHREV